MGEESGYEEDWEVNYQTGVKVRRARRVQYARLAHEYRDFLTFFVSYMTKDENRACTPNFMFVKIFVLGHKPKILCDIKFTPLLFF